MEIDVKLQTALSNLSKNLNIAPKELRIRISKPEGKLQYDVMKNADVVKKTNLATALNLNVLEAFILSGKLDEIFSTLSKQNDIYIHSLNVRIFTKTEDCYPSLYLFDDTTPKKVIRLEEFST